MAKKKSGGRKTEAVFDPRKRAEFLTGFRKRKNERRRRAAEEFKQKIQTEYKKVREAVKAGIMLKKSYEPIKPVTETDKFDCVNVYKDDNTEVKVLELSAFGLGEQKPTAPTVVEQVVDENSNDADDLDCIPGMETKASIEKKVPTASVAAKEKDNSKELLYKNHTKKDLNKIVQNATLKKLNKSKVFKQKKRIERIENKKGAKKKNAVKTTKKNRSKNKNDPRLYSKGHLKNRKTLRKMRES